MTPQVRSRLIAIAGLSAGLVALQVAGASLPLPALDPAAWSNEWTAPDPLLPIAAVLRLVAMAVGVWLLVVTLLDTLALTLNAVRLQRLARLVAPRFWRTVVLRPIAVGAIALPPLVSPLSVTPALAQSAIELPGTDLEVRGETDPAPRTITMRWHEPTASTDEVTTEPTAPTPDVAPPTIDPPPIYRVSPGENLWSIAALHLRNEMGHRPSASEVNHYWLSLIEANRSRLPDPSNPDLVYAGVELTLPARS